MTELNLIDDDLLKLKFSENCVFIQTNMHIEDIEHECTTYSDVTTYHTSAFRNIRHLERHISSIAFAGENFI